MNAQSERPWPEREDIYPGEGISFTMDSNVDDDNDRISRAFARFLAAVIAVSLATLVASAIWWAILWIWADLSRM